MQSELHGATSHFVELDGTFAISTSDGEISTPDAELSLEPEDSSVRARDKIRSRVPQTQRSASSRGLAIGIAMAF
jgi:hypothetical protein